MNFTRRMVTTSQPKIHCAAWEEVRCLFLNLGAVRKYDISDELIINVDQTPSKCVPTDNINMAKKIAADKRCVTVTLSETLKGDILPFQIIYKGKTSRSLPSVQFPEGFCLSFKPTGAMKLKQFVY